MTDERVAGLFWGKSIAEARQYSELVKQLWDALAVDVNSAVGGIEGPPSKEQDDFRKAFLNSLTAWRGLYERMQKDSPIIIAYGDYLTPDEAYKYCQTYETLANRFRETFRRVYGRSASTADPVAASVQAQSAAMNPASPYAAYVWTGLGLLGLFGVGYMVNSVRR